ncbi:MAG: acetyl-CoA hydrolase/transferase family protein, partial [Candidatus Saccharibacteria bacterium]
MNEFAKREYEQKRTTAENAVQLVCSGDTIYYGEFALFPEALDKALAQRVNELENITVRSTFFTKLPKIADVDSDNKHFIIEDYHFSSISRVLQHRNLCYYIPMLYHQVPGIIEKFIDIDVVFVTTSPMDAKGFFNFGLANSVTAAALNKAKIIVVEVNENVPACLGGNQEAIHISRVTHIVESDHAPLVEVKPFEPREIDYKIAEHIMNEIEDGSCLQLGIGGLPSIIGSMIADSDIKDLGCHTEILTDSAVKLFESGKMTGARKVVDKYKLTYTFALGTKKLYDFLSDNPICASYPADYITDPSIIAINDNVVAVNNALEVDIFGQVCSETIGSRQISGSGGQLEFMLGAFGSMGGK